MRYSAVDRALRSAVRLGPMIIRRRSRICLTSSAERPIHRPMPLDLPKTTSKRDGPLVKQFSVFLPNKVGAMLDIVKLLNSHSCHVVAMSVSESTDSAIARVIVSDPEGVEKLFRQNNIAFGMCEVNVHFTYPLLMRPCEQAALALHVDDNDCAISVLNGAGFTLLSQSDIS